MQPNNNQQPNPITTQTPRPGSETNLRPDIVSNIPLKTQANALTALNEDHDLDKIMHDVGQNLGQDGPSRHKKRFFDLKRQPKAAKPAPRPQPIPSQLIPAKAKAGAQPKPPKKQSSAPVLTITLTIIVTGVLIAAAIYAYK